MNINVAKEKIVALALSSDHIHGCRSIDHHGMAQHTQKLAAAEPLFSALDLPATFLLAQCIMHERTPPHKMCIIGQEQGEICIIMSLPKDHCGILL